MVIKIVLLCVVTICVCGFFWLFSSDVSSLCSNTTIFAKYAPDNAYKAIVFERDCGATTAPSVQISLLPADEQLDNDTGNTFIADSVSSAKSDKDFFDIRVSWITKGKLNIEVASRARIFKNETQVNGILVSYSKIE